MPATRRKCAAPASEEPPNFITIMGLPSSEPARELCRVSGGEDMTGSRGMFIEPVAASG